MPDDAVFREKAPEIMRLLMADFDLALDDAAAILGNIGHECLGFRAFQELKPLVPGSAGGFGWCMWTGPRRRGFEAYVARNRLDPKSDKANYGWLWNELHGAEKSAIAALKRAPTLEGKVKAFELSFERAAPRYKHYESRNAWAVIALDAFAKATPASQPPPRPAPIPLPPPEPRSLIATLFEALASLFKRTS